MKKGTAIGLIFLAVVIVVLIVVFIPRGAIDDTQEIMESEEAMESEVLSYMDISSMDAQELISNNPDLIIIDVSPSYNNGHLPGAINYYVGDGSLDEAIPMLDKMAMYLVYCHFDSASRAGAQKLIDAGFTNVYRLEDHYGGWVDAGYSIEI